MILCLIKFLNAHLEIQVKSSKAVTHKLVRNPYNPIFRVRDQGLHEGIGEFLGYRLIFYITNWEHTHLNLRTYSGIANHRNGRKEIHF